MAAETGISGRHEPEAAQSQGTFDLLTVFVQHDER